MKITSLLKGGLLALVLSFYASTSFASADIFLHITDEKGKVTKVAVDKDGKFECPVLPAGTYKVKLHWDLKSQTKRSSNEVTRVSKPVSNEPKAIAFTYSVKAPRDVATGQASGKRTHNPMTIRKELDKASASSFTYDKIEFDNEFAMTGTVVLEGTDGKTMAMDDWHESK